MAQVSKERLVDCLLSISGGARSDLPVWPIAVSQESYDLSIGAGQPSGRNSRAKLGH